MSLDFYLVVEVDTGGNEPHHITLFRANATHNLGQMWREAGVHDAIYESHGKKAGEILPELAKALATMKADPERFENHNPSNGWGSYKTAIVFLGDVLMACECHPKATISICR